jgi:hypothetical protein
MAIIQVQAQLTSEELLQAIEQLPQPELARFTEQVLALRLRQTAPVLSQDESELLMSINQGVPADLQQRYDGLIAKRGDGTLTPEEHTELLDLTDQIEQIDAQRMEQLVTLAGIRHIPLTQLMDDLGIGSQAYE